jgi:hypothetical protein
MRLCLTLFVSATLAVAADPFVGTWKPDLRKWKLVSDAPEAKEHVYTIAAAGKDTYRTMITEEGKEAITYVLPVDGKERTEESPGIGLVTTKSERLGNGHFKMILSGPKGTMFRDLRVSSDGKTLTISKHGTGLRNGIAFNETLVYTKQ